MKMKTGAMLPVDKVIEFCQGKLKQIQDYRKEKTE
jgi:hypothetical protein